MKWIERGLFDSTEQRICDQARAIRKNRWLSDVELEAIGQRVETENEEEEDKERENRREEEFENTETKGIVVEDAVECVGDDYEGEGMVGDEQDIQVAKDESSADVRIIIDEVLVKEIIATDEGIDGISFEKVDRRRLIECTNRVTDAIKYIRTNDSTEINALLRAADVWIAHTLGLKRSAQRKRTDEPWWKRRIQGDIKVLRRHINILEREKRGEMKKRGRFRELDNKYHEKEMFDNGNGKTKAKAYSQRTKIKRYE